MGGGNGIAHGAEIAGTASPQGKPAKRAGEIRCGLQLLPERLAQARFLAKITDRIEAGIHRRRIGQRASEPAGKLPRAGGGDGAVDGRQQTSGAGALV